MLDFVWATSFLTKITVDLLSSSPWELRPPRILRLLGLITKEIELTPGGPDPRENDKPLVIVLGTI